MIILCFKVQQDIFVQIFFWSAVLQITSLTAALGVMSHGSLNKLNCKKHGGDEVSMSLIQVWYVRCEAFGFEIILLELYSLSSVVINSLHFVYLFVSLHQSPFLSYSFRMNIRNLVTPSFFFNFAKYFLRVHILFCYNLAVFTRICISHFIMRSCLF